MKTFYKYIQLFTIVPLIILAEGRANGLLQCSNHLREDISTLLKC